MLNSVSASSQIPFAVRFNQASNSLVRANDVREVEPVAPSLPENPSRPVLELPQLSPEEQSNLRHAFGEVKSDFQQSQADSAEAKRSAVVGLDNLQHQQNMIDIYLSVALGEESSSRQAVSFSDLQDLSKSVELYRAVDSEADFDAIQSSRESLQQQYEAAIKPSAESFIQIQA